MKTVGVAEAKNNLSKLIAGLRGGPVLITDRGRPVARLESAETGEAESLRELVRLGMVTPARKRLAKDFFTRPLTQAKPGYSAADALIAERRSGR